MSTVSEARRRPRIFYGWWIVAAAAAMNVYGAGVWYYGFPIFYKALLDEFGWGAAATAGAISISRLQGGIQAPLVGWLVDKFGPRRLAIAGAVIAGLGFFAMSRVSSFSIGPVHVGALLVFYLLYIGVMSPGYNMGFSHSSIAAVNAWFVKKRSRAFALFSLGAGGSGLTVYILGRLVESYGWRPAAFLAGVGLIVITIPLALVLRHRPEQYGYLPDGEEPEEESATPVEGKPVSAEATPASSGEMGHEESSSKTVQWAQHDFSVKEALLTLTFWMLILASATRSITMTSVVVHEINYLTDIGISLSQASAALGAMVTISLIGRFAFGFLGDYFDKRYMLVTAALLQAVGIFLLDRVSSMPQVWLFVVVYGIGYGGAIPVYMAIVGEYFGRKSYATIRGFQQLFLIPAAVLGPVYAGWVFDTTGSYHWAFMSFIASLLVGTVFILLARRPKPSVAAA